MAVNIEKARLEFARLCGLMETIRLPDEATAKTVAEAMTSLGLALDLTVTWAGTQHRA